MGAVCYKPKKSSISKDDIIRALNKQHQKELITEPEIANGTTQVGQKNSKNTNENNESHYVSHISFSNFTHQFNQDNIDTSLSKKGAT
jgi:hypothetical protein